MGDVSKSKVEFVKGGVQPGSAVDEKHCVGDLVFLREFLVR